MSQIRTRVKMSSSKIKFTKTVIGAVAMRVKKGGFVFPYTLNLDRAHKMIKLRNGTVDAKQQTFSSLY